MPNSENASHPRTVVVGERVPYGPVRGGGLRIRVTIEAMASMGRVAFFGVIRRPWGVDTLAETARRFEFALQYANMAKRDRVCRLHGFSGKSVPGAWTHLIVEGSRVS